MPGHLGGAVNCRVKEDKYKFTVFPFQEKKREEKVRELSSSPAEATIVKATGEEEVQGDYTQVLTHS